MTVNRGRIGALLFMVALCGGVLYLGGLAAWKLYATRQNRFALDKERKAAFDAVFKPCYERLGQQQLEEQRQLTQQRLSRVLDNIGNPHARRRQDLMDAIQDSYMEERHENELHACMEEEAVMQGRTATGATR